MKKGTRSRMAVGAFCFVMDNWECAPQEKLLPAVSVQERSAGPEAGRGVPTPPSLPLDSTHPATGQGLHALDNPKEEVEAQKS